MWANKPPLNLQKQVLKNQEDIETLSTDITNLNTKVDNLPTGGIDFDKIDINGGIVVTKTLDTATFANGTATFLKDNTPTTTKAVSISLPITGVGGIVVDASEESNALQFKLDSHYYDRISIEGVPTSSTGGTLTQSQVNRLVNADVACITFNNENYYKSDNQHTTGTLVFSHVGYENTLPFIKTITVTISTRAWVLTTIKVPTAVYQATMVLLGNTYNSIPIVAPGDLSHKDVLENYFYGAANPFPGIAFKYGNDIYIAYGVFFNWTGNTTTNGGSIDCVKLSDGTQTTLNFSATQMYLDDVGYTIIPGTDSNF